MELSIIRIILQQLSASFFIKTTAIQKKKNFSYSE